MLLSAFSEIISIMVFSQNGLYNVDFSTKREAIIFVQLRGIQLPYICSLAIKVEIELPSGE